MNDVTPDPIAYGPTGYTCGCGKPAHSNITPCAPSDAELIEHARTVGMVEPERAAEFVAAFRAQVEERSAAAGTQPVPLLDGITAEEAAANITVNAPALAATGHMAAAGFARGIAQAAIARPDVEEQPAQAVPGDLFTEAAIRHSALTAGADAVKAMAERNPWKTVADADALLRRMAAFHTTAEQPTGLTWEARAEHAVRLYATTAIELEDARRDAAKLRECLAELEQDQADADTIAPLETAVMEQPEPTDLTERPEDTARRFVRRLNAAERLCSGRPGYHTITVKQLLTAMSDADDGQAEEQPATPTVGDRYISRNVNRTVTVTRVWTVDDGHTAVAYEWRDDRPGQCGSACPLDVFHREYRPEASR